jgi:hypothetical protein
MYKSELAALNTKIKMQALSRPGRTSMPATLMAATNCAMVSISAQF